MQMVKQSDLAPYYKTLVQNGQTGGITSRDIYESDLMLLNRKVQESKREYINHYLLEEEDDELDRLGTISTMFDSNEETVKLILTGLSLWRGHLTEVESLLDGCTSIHGQTDYLCQVLGIVLQHKLSGSMQLQPRGIEALQALAADESTCGYTQARAWLSQYTEAEFPQNIGLNRGAVKSLVAIEEIEPTAGLLSAQPNPSQGAVYLTYLLPEGMEVCELEIVDGNGKLIEKRLASGKGLEEWNCKECPSGIYMIRLVANGIELATTKVSIVK